MATLPTQANAASDVYPGGLATLRVQFETYRNSGIACQANGVTVAVTASGAADGGLTDPVPATATGVTELGNGLFEYDWAVAPGLAAGSYLVTWTGARATDGLTVTYRQAVMVAADPSSVPLPGVYATVQQFRDWSGDQFTPDTRVAVALQRASEDLDVALVAAVYRTDADGMPLDAGIANCFMRACCAQAQYVIAVNDDANVKREFSATSAGGVSATRAAATAGRAMPPVAPRALSILRVAGVLPAAPLINW